MRKKLIELINVKSFVTIMLTSVFAFMSVNGNVSSEQFITVFTTVIAFYFGTQHEKKKEEPPS